MSCHVMSYHVISCHIMSYPFGGSWPSISSTGPSKAPFIVSPCPCGDVPRLFPFGKGKSGGTQFCTIDLGLIIWQFFPGQWSYIYRPDFLAFFFGVGTSNQSDPGMAIRPGVPFFSWPRWRRNFAMPLFGMWKTVTVGRGREVRWRRDSARGWVSTNLVAYFQGQSLKIYQRYLAWETYKKLLKMAQSK